MKISEATNGMRVVYRPLHAISEEDFEYGTISSYNDTFIFVKFDAQIEKLGWDGTTAQSCNPDDLIPAKYLELPVTPDDADDTRPTE